jgi:hypothetical protein
MTVELEKERSVYQANLLELLANEGKYVVIKEDVILGPYDAYEQATAAGYDRFGPVPLFVKKIHREEPIHYFSRGLP